MSEKEMKKEAGRDLFKSLFKDIGFYFIILVLGLLSYASQKVYEVYGVLLGRKESIAVLVIAYALLVAILGIVFIYKPTSIFMSIPVFTLYFGVLWDIRILFRISLVTAIIYPFYVIIFNYFEFKKSEKELTEKFK